MIPGGRQTLRAHASSGRYAETRQLAGIACPTQSTPIPKHAFRLKAAKTAVTIFRCSPAPASGVGVGRRGGEVPEEFSRPGGFSSGREFRFVRRKRLRMLHRETGRRDRAANRAGLPAIHEPRPAFRSAAGRSVGPDLSGLDVIFPRPPLAATPPFRGGDERTIRQRPAWHVPPRPIVAGFSPGSRRNAASCLPARGAICPVGRHYLQTTAATPVPAGAPVTAETIHRAVFAVGR